MRRPHGAHRLSELGQKFIGCPLPSCPLLESTTKPMIAHIERRAQPERLFLEGRALHARNDGTTPTHVSPPFGHRPIAYPRWQRHAPASVRPIFADAQSASLRENRPLRTTFGLSPKGHSTLERPRLGGAGSARPWAKHHANQNVASFPPLTFRGPLRDNDVSRLADGLAMRARRPRPSEKTGHGVISRLVASRLRVLDLPSSRRGGLRTPAKGCPGIADAPSPLGHLVRHVNPGRNPFHRVC